MKISDDIVYIITRLGFLVLIIVVYAVFIVLPLALAVHFIKIGQEGWGAAALVMANLSVKLAYRINNCLLYLYIRIYGKELRR